MNQDSLRTPRSGFTFIEVICILLVIAVGLMGVLGLVAYGMSVANSAQNATTGMVTAISVAADPQPLLDPSMASSWSYTPYSMNATNSTQVSTAQGFVNGYYVVRTETSVDIPGTYSDILAQDPTTMAVYVRSAAVTVNVYDTLAGNLVTTYTTRLVRQQGHQ